MERAPSSSLRIGPFEVDLAAHELRRAGVRIHLQEKQFQLLAAFLQKPSEVVTREELRKALWPTEQYGEFDMGLNQAVRRLRRALGDSARRPKWIETLPKVGYRFIGPVPEPLSTPARTSTQSPPPRLLRALFAVIIGLLVIGLAAWGYVALISPSRQGESFDPTSMTSFSET